MADILAEAIAVKETADCLFDEAAVQAALDTLAEQVTRDYAGRNPVLMTAMNGGLWTTAQLAQRLDFPFQMDYLHATRYRDETTGSGLIWKAEPQMPLLDRHVLIIDDILDEGITLEHIQRAITSQEPSSVSTLVLTLKEHERRVEGAMADYVGLILPDRYVFGCGMDYKSFWRQLPAIYAGQGM